MRNVFLSFNGGGLNTESPRVKSWGVHVFVTERLDA